MANPLDSIPDVGANPLDSLPNVGPNPLDSLPDVRPATPSPSIGADVLHGAEDFGRGMLASGAGTARGAMQLVGLGSDVPAALKYRAPKDWEGDAGDIVGNVGQFVGMQFIPGVGDIKDAEILAKAPAMLRESAQLAAQSGLLAALQPAKTEMGHVYHGIEGAAIGALGGPLDKVLSVVGHGTGHLAGDALKLFTKAGRKALGDAEFARAVKAAGSPQALARTLEKARTAMAGDTATAAQVIDNPEAFQAERQLAKTAAGKGIFAKRVIANNHARVQVLHEMAGTDAEMQAAIDKRAGDFAPMAARLADSWMSPKFVIDAAQKVVAQNADAAPFAESMVRDIRAAQGASRMNGLVSGERLRSLRSALHTKLTAAAVGRSASADERHGVEALRQAVTDELDKVIPGFRVASAKYAEDSASINAMQSARTALEDVADRKQLPGGDPLIAAHDVERALDRDGASEFKMPEAARQKLADVRDSLLRDSRSNFDVGTVPVAGLADALRRTFASPWTSRFLGESVLGGGIGAGVGARHGDALKGGLLGMAAGLGVEALRGLVGPAIDRQAALDAADAGQAGRVLDAINKTSRLREGTAAALRAAARALPAAGVATHLQGKPLVVPIRVTNRTPQPAWATPAQVQAVNGG